MCQVLHEYRSNRQTKKVSLVESLRLVKVKAASEPDVRFFEIVLASRLISQLSSWPFFLRWGKSSANERNLLQPSWLFDQLSSDKVVGYYEITIRLSHPNPFITLSGTLHK